MLDVVLIDDEYFFRNSLKHSIPWEEHGFRIVGDTNNGNTGMDLILSKNPDIAIIDINMPVLTGLELIENLTEKQVHCKYILLTGYDEFKYAQKAIRLNVSEYILKPVDFSLLLESLNNLKMEILNEKEKSRHIQDLVEQRNIQIKENFLSDLLNGYFSFNEARLSSYLKELGIHLPFENYVVFLIDLSKTSSGKLEELRSVLKESLYRHHKAEVFLTGHSQICVLEEVNNPAASSGVLDPRGGCQMDIQACPPGSLPAGINSSRAASLLGAHLRMYLNPVSSDYHIGISLPHHGTEEMIIAYKEARICLKDAISRGTPILNSDQLSTPYFHLPQEQTDSLKKLIRLRDMDRIESQLASLYGEFRQKKLSHDNVVFCTYELLSCLFSALNEQNSINCLGNPNSQNIFETISTIRSAEELENWLISLFREQLELLRTRGEEESSVSDRIEEYIKKYYSNPELNIDLISKNLFLNYSYICYCFKRDRGITINDYVNQIRLEKALELFHSGIDNVSYVSEQTGFNNSGYFSKKFKKAFGLSPTEYIKTL